MTVVPVLATDRPWHEVEMRALASRWSATMRTWFARRGLPHVCAWSVERSRREGVHLHAIFAVPRPIAGDARRHSRAVLARLMGCDPATLHPRAVRHHGRGGGVPADRAAGWWRYMRKGVDARTPHRAKADQLLPMTGRRLTRPNRKAGATDA